MMQMIHVLHIHVHGVTNIIIKKNNANFKIYEDVAFLITGIFNSNSD